MRPYGAKGTDSVQAVKSCVDDSRRGGRPVIGVAGWVGRPEWAGGPWLRSLSWPCPPQWRRAREAFLGRVWSQRIVKGLERSLQRAIVPGW
jgi:hypothetical protein